MARVTLVVNNFDEGSETFLHSLARELVEIGHEVTVHVLLEGRTLMHSGDTFDMTGVQRSSALPELRSMRFPKAAARQVLADPAVMRLATGRALAAFGTGRRAGRAALVAAPLLATRPDVVHVAFSGIAVAIADALRLLDPPTKLVVSCRGSGELVAPHLDDSLGPRLAELLDSCDAVHAVADVVRDAVVAMGASDDLVTVIRPAVDVDRFRPLPQSRQRGDRLRIISVARLHWVKGIDVQLAAAAQLKREGLSFDWTVVGDGPDRRELQVRTLLADLEDSVTFVGALGQEELRHRLQEADVFVSASLSEGTSNSVLEAMALGLPVVSSSAGGMTEVLSDGVDSLVVPVGDAASLAAALWRVADDPDGSAKLGRAARLRVGQGLTTELQKAEWARLYSEVLTTATGRD